MRIYQGTTQEFIQDTVHNRITDKIKEHFETYYGRRASPSEITSWTNSLQFLKNVVEHASPPDNMIALEYELPYSTERIDCLLFGKGADGRDSVVIIELKQWSQVADCEIADNIITFVGGARRMVPHPSFQVRGYHYYLEDFVELFHEKNSADLSSCVYCHNYSKLDDAVLLAPKFEGILKEFPVYTKDDFEELSDFLKAKIECGNGLEIFDRFIHSRIKPSQRLIDVTRRMIEGQKVFNLIDEQLTARNAIVDRAKKCAKLKKKFVIIVRGGPGTGKSVIALDALAELLRGKNVVYHATGSKAFTSTLRKVVGPRASELFKYFNSFSAYGPNEIKVLICDEAHRIRSSGNSRFTPKGSRSELPQIDELINVAKVCVFFIDDWQIVRPGEIGSSELIRSAAAKCGCDLYEFELTTQFRCNGSDGYLAWLENTLMVRDAENKVLTKNEKMDFRIFDTPTALYEAVKGKNKEKPNSARMVAGFCWPWSTPRRDGTLVEDVVIEDLRMPWEGREGFKLAKGIPYWYQWAYDANGVNQCGCIYTIQGFEFDYVGVIFGNDLVYDPKGKSLVGQPKNSRDPVLKKSSGSDFTNYAKHVYRVLMSRGMSGCYMYFVDKETERFFRSRLESDPVV